MFVVPSLRWRCPRGTKSDGQACIPMIRLSHAGPPLLWPGGASVPTFAAELLAGPMWGGREGGPGCPSRQPGKRSRRSRPLRRAIFQHGDKCIAKLTPQAMIPSFFCSLPVWPLIVHRFRPRRSGVTLWARQFARSPFQEDTARSSSSDPSGLLMEEVLSACGWTVAGLTLGFLKLFCVACWFIRGL